MKKFLVLLSATICIPAISQTLPALTWNSYLIKDPQQSAGFIDIADFNNDGKQDIVLSTLQEQGSASSPWNTKGAIRIFTQPTAGISGTWAEQVVLPLTSNLPFCNYPQVMDVDMDGNEDILLQQGFLTTNGGSHQWLKGPAFTNRYDFAPQTAHGSTYSFWHESEQTDLDGDGLMDIVTTSAQTQDATHANNSTLSVKKAKVEWYRNTGGGNFQYYQLNDSLGGVFIKLYDVDGDNDKDIVLSQFFWNTNRPALVWLENVSAPAASNSYAGVWAYHTIDHSTGLGYHFEFYDIDNDGADELVYDNHNNEDNTAIVDQLGNEIMPGLFYFDIPANAASVTQWNKTLIYDGFRTNLYDFGNPASQGTPGIFAIGDVDLNGMPDVVVPGDGNDTLYLFRQRSNHTFQKEILDNGKMFGHVKLADLDNDGTLEIIAAKHNFPELWQILFPPAGFLKVYKATNVMTGTKDEVAGISVSVYPNPASETLTIETPNENAVVKITDVSGRDVSGNITHQKNKFYADIKHLSKGVYFVQMISGSENKSIPFIKD